MLRTTKWKIEKPKVKAVFRLQFHATNIPPSGWEKLFICFIPTESGKITAKTSKANVRNGTCKWADPIYETTKLLVDSRNKRYDDNLYRLVVGMGTSRSSILGEATINLADFADASNPYVISLPLHGSDYGTILHVTVQLLTGKTGFREFEQQFDKGLQSSSNLNREVETNIATSSSSELQISDDLENKVNAKTHFGSESKELLSSIKETVINEEYSESPIECDNSSNTSETYYAEKIDSSSIHEPDNHIQLLQTEKDENQKWSSDYSRDNELAIAHEENHRLRGILEMAESSIFELKMELTSLHSYANEMGTETQKIAHQLTAEIYSGQKLERDIMVMKSECFKLKDELNQLKEIKSSSNFFQRVQDQDQLTWVNGLLVVEDQIRVLQEKIHIGFHESDLSFLNSDLEVLLRIVQDLEKGTIEDKKSLILLNQLDESKAERENLVRKMNEMECYYESLVQELEENQKQILGEFQSLRYAHSMCGYTISTCKTENDSIRNEMDDQIIRFTKERHDLEKKVMIAESLVQDLEENQERILGEFQIHKNEHSRYRSETELLHHDMNNQILKFSEEKHTLNRVNLELEKRVKNLEENKKRILGEFQRLKNEHSTCAETISNCKSKNESLRHEMKDNISKFAKERQELSCVNDDLKKRAVTLEKLVQNLEENKKQILGELQSLENEHLTCADVISNCKSKNESLHHEMKDLISEFAKERQELSCVNDDLNKRVTTAETLVQNLEENKKQILGELRSLQNEHLICAEIISSNNSKNESLLHEMKDHISRFEKERHELSCINEDLKKRVTTAETLVQNLEENKKQSLEIEHLACAETISNYKSENESLRHEMKDHISNFEKERQELNCVNAELEKRVTNAESALKRARENYSIAVTQLQKDLDMLSSQVLSMFETNQNLIKESFSESSDPFPNIVENLQKPDDASLVFEKQLTGDGNCEISCANLYLDLYSTTLEETLFEANNDSNKMKEKLKENEAQINDFQLQNRKLEESLESVLRENFLLMEKITECEALLTDYRVYKSRYEIASVEKLEMEKSKEKMQKLFDFLHEKFGNLLDEQSGEKFSFNDSSCQDVDFRYIIYVITKLEELHNYTDEKIEDLKKERDMARSEVVNMRTKFMQDMHDTSSKLDLTNTLVGKLQLQAESVANKFENSLEMMESYLLHTEGLLKYLSFLELELHNLSSKDGNFIQEILGSERAKLTISGLNEENQDFLISMENKEESTICEELEMENIRVVLKATLDEHYDKYIILCDKCNELSNKLSEQVLKTEEIKNMVKLKDSEKQDLEGPSESLRLAFMKEQCETTVQELKHELYVSKRHGEDILVKLQDVLDETEIRKKSEASYLKKIEELSIKIVGLEGELQSIHAELECALLNLECCKEEKEKTLVSLQKCEDEKSKISLEFSLFRECLSRKEENASTTPVIELEGINNEKSILSMASSGSSFQDLQRNLLQLHKANEEIRSMYPNFEDFSGDGNALERVIALEMELAEALVAKNKSNIQFQSCFLKQHGDEEAIFKSFRDINEVIKDTLEVKGKYVNLETELKEMHERYSQLSLQFAEVEGERQKLMMTIKNVRSPKNLGTRDDSLF